jgi:pimeloyl-ACP methyl ester carboxylesterase
MTLRRSVQPSSRPAIQPSLARLAIVVLAASGAAPAPARRPAPPTFAEVQLATGVRMHYAVQGDPDGTPVILLHGVTDSWFSWSRVLPLLPAGWRVYALDQRGHGGTSVPQSGYGLPTLADDVIAFLDAQGVERAIVVGHSMGGLVAQHVAAAAPERVSRLVLVNAAAVPGNPGLAELLRAVDALPGPVPESFAREFQASTIHGPVPEDFFRQVVSISLAVPLHVWRGALGGFFPPDANAPLARIGAPTLLLWGERDAVFSRSDQAALLDGIAGSRLITYPETGHAPHWERPEQVARDVRNFLEGR